MPETTPPGGTPTPAAPTPDPTAARMNDLIRDRSSGRPGPWAREAPAPGTPATGQDQTPAVEPMPVRMRTRAEEIDARIGQGGFRDATERAYLTGYGKALLDWAETLEAETGA